jgi:hypothetical protein
LSPLREVLDSIIFICLTPDPKGGHLKIIELGSPLLGDLGGQLLFGVWSLLKLQAFFAKKIRFLVNVIRNLLATNQKHKT